MSAWELARSLHSFVNFPSHVNTGLQTSMIIYILLNDELEG